ncbi:tetratricopeptide repeat-containing sulfotransferase family protein [Sphingomonas arenae]|uniref:tetratricopeptide repeat-containing sulfotransferase family protein n=1 Tax=Sphingomonas arenae TaxID=2812555 RepID=UPI00196834ED|nr:tetratricopeptide repeat-containing sulfotransferase family protein [Sphingomonas arenae]
MNQPAQLDPDTVAAIRQAMSAAGRGQLAEACAIGERALAAGNDGAALHAMLGMLWSRSGDLAAGIGHLRHALDERPDDLLIRTNLATALTENKDYAAALDVATQAAAAADPSLRLLRLRAFCAQLAERFDIAVQAYDTILAAEPDDWEAWNNLGNARRCAGDFPGSVAALRQAAQIAPGSAAVRLNLAQALAETGEGAEAEQLLQALADEFPDDTTALLQLHALRRDQGRDEDALGPIREAVARDRSNIDLLVGLASHHVRLLDYPAAEREYRRAIALDPAHPVGNLGLASVFELTNRTEELAALAREAEAKAVRADALNFIRAMDHRRAKRFDQGLVALEQVPDELETPRRTHLLGQLLDGAGRYDEAFGAFGRMNALAIADPSDPVSRGASYRAQVRAQTASLTPAWQARWRPFQPTDVRSSPAFLLGFPRSGTTLLDTMLMGHPGLEVLEEEPALRDAQQLLPDVTALPDLADAQIQAARDAYFARAATLAPLAPGSLLIDKNPLASNMLPWIARLFPDARIILALRHPCDVVLSCVITNFRLNDGMASFLDVATAAELYDLTFRNLERAQELLGLPLHQVRYEAVVTDPEQELRALSAFLGLDWSDRVLDHQATARDRGRIKTASYAQVTEPLYKRASGRWEKYRTHLEPVLPVLQPWIDKFGYSV